MPNTNNPIIGNGLNLDGTGAKVYNATISTEWTEDMETGAKYQIVSIAGITSKNTANVDVAYTHNRDKAGYETFVNEQNEFLTYITNGDAETVDGGIKFYIYGDTNTIPIPIVIEVV